MQELKDVISEMIKNGGTEEDLFGVISHIDNWGIQKEKEQIIEAFEVGYKSCDIDEAFEINRKLASGELHYNKTYNQNK